MVYIRFQLISFISSGVVVNRSAARLCHRTTSRHTGNLFSPEWLHLFEGWGRLVLSFSTTPRKLREGMEHTADRLVASGLLQRVRRHADSDKDQHHMSDKKKRHEEVLGSLNQAALVVVSRMTSPTNSWGVG